MNNNETHSEAEAIGDDVDQTQASGTLSVPTLIARSSFGGFLMGLANLVPGISGGTMLLAAGIYPKFIDAVANVTRLKFRFHSLLVLACVVGAAGLGILLLAGTLKDLVTNQRWMMYSLFIGLTLGGLPIVYKLAKPITTRGMIAALVAFGLMVALAVLQAIGYTGSGSSNFLMLFIAGMAGASAMILPGISGGYLLLLLGQYVPILGGIDDFKEALKAKDISAMMEPALTVVLPVGLGVVIGVVVVGNLLQWLLKQHRQVTLGALLGLLLGSTVGLWPFQQPVAPKVGDTIKGQVVTNETINDIEPDDYPTVYFSPSGPKVGIALGLIGLGFAITMGVALVGGDESDASS